MKANRIDEAYTYSVVNPNSPYVPKTEHIRIINPVTETAAELRDSLIPNLVESLEYNLRHRNREVRLFEIGHVFLKDGEKTALGIALLGDYRELKGIIEGALPALHYSSPTFRKGEDFFGRSENRRNQTTSGGLECRSGMRTLLDRFSLIPTTPLIYQPINPYPFVERDASLLLVETISYNQIEQTFRGLQIP